MDLLKSSRFQRRPFWDQAIFNKTLDGDRKLSSKRNDTDLARSARALRKRYGTIVITPLQVDTSANTTQAQRAASWRSGYWDLLIP